MTAQHRNRVIEHIQKLKSRLDRWKSRPMMLKAVRDIGTRAIRREISHVSRELKLDDVHHMRY